jgi:hypothetical protein
VPRFRYLSALLALVAASMLLAACGEKDEPAVAPPIAAQPAQPNEPAPAPPAQPEPGAPTPGPNEPKPETPAPQPPRPAGEQIAGAVRGVLVSGDPDLACRRYATGRLLTQSFGGLTGCIAATKPRTAADSVRLRGLVVNGNRATVIAIPKGGTSSGEHVRVTLIVREGLWRVDTLHSNVPVGP